MRGRPLLRTSYEADQALFPTVTQRVIMTVFLVLLVAIPLFRPGTVGRAAPSPDPISSPLTTGSDYWSPWASS